MMDARGKIKVQTADGIWHEIEDRNWQYVDGRLKLEKPYDPRDHMTYAEALQYDEDYAYRNCY